MSKIQKITDGVFTSIVETSNRKSSYERFINTVGTENGYLLNSLLDQYKEMIYENEDLFNQLSTIEELIIQIKLRENMEEIKLFTLRDYIYARTTFFIKGKDRCEVRSIIDRLDNHPDKTIDDLYHDESFMNLVSNKLKSLMDIEIQKNIKSSVEV